MKQDFLDISLTTSFGVRNFGNTEAMRFIFFKKCSRIDVHFKNPKKKKNLRKNFFFLRSKHLNFCIKLSLLRTQYLSSEVGVLTNSIKIFHFTKTDFFQLNYLHSDQ